MMLKYYIAVSALKMCADKLAGSTLAHMSLVVRKPAFSICENKDADQLRGNCEADQRLCFRYTDRTIPLLPKYEISSLQPSSVAVESGLSRTWSETPKTGFLTTRLTYFHTAYHIRSIDRTVHLGFSKLPLKC